MKWNPFGKNYLQIPNKKLDKALHCIPVIREAIGEKIDLLIEGHGRFDGSTGIRIAKELEQFHPMFLKNQFHQII